MYVEKLKSLKFKLGKGATNIDPRYFTENEDGSYSLTSTFIYNVLRDGLEFYKKKVFALDKDCQYHTEKMAVLKDTWTEKKNKEILNLRYGDQLKELERRKRQWREANPDKCQTRSGGIDLGDEDEMRFFGGYRPDFDVSLKDAVSLYKFLKEYTDSDVGKALKDEIPEKPGVLMVAPEYKAEYQALADKWYQELGLPMESEEVGTVERVKYTINQLRNANMKNVTSSDNGFEEFVNGLIGWVTSSDKIEYRKQREACLELIEKDFAVIINDVSKNLKATADIDATVGKTEIDIFTKRTEDFNALKIISIFKEEPTDNYKYLFRVDTDQFESTFYYSREITTKADLIKALKTTKLMIEGTSEFKKYVEDIDSIIESIDK